MLDVVYATLFIPLLHKHNIVLTKFREAFPQLLMNAWIETDGLLSSGDDHRQVTYDSMTFY